MARGLLLGRQKKACNSASRVAHRVGTCACKPALRSGGWQAPLHLAASLQAALPWGTWTSEARYCSSPKSLVAIDDAHVQPWSRYTDVKKVRSCRNGLVEEEQRLQQEEQQQRGSKH